MNNLLVGFKKYSVQIGILFIGLVAAILGAQKLAAIQGRKSAELDADIQKDVFDKAAAHDVMVEEVTKAKEYSEKAVVARNKAIDERNKLVVDLKKETKGMLKSEILDYINRVE